MLPHRHLLVPDPASGSPPMDADDPSATSSSAPPTSDAATSSSSPPASDAAFVDAPAAGTSSSAPPASEATAFVDAPSAATSSSAPPASDAAFVDAPASGTSSSAPPSSDAAFVDAPAAVTSSSAPPAFVDAPAAGTSSSAPPASEAAAFFDAPDALSTPPTPPPPHPHPHTPSSSTLHRRARRAKILNPTDDLLSSSASAASTVTAADEPGKGKVKPKPEPEPDSSEASSASRSPPSLEEKVDDKDSQPTSPESESDEKHAEPEAAARDHRPAPSALESLAVLIVKAVVFQFSALVACLAFPFRLLQWWYLFVTDPLGSAQRAKDWALGVAGQATGAVTSALGAGDGVGRVAVRLVCGALWALYVCGVLCALLVMAFLAGGFLVGKVVEEPVQMTENLNFDYTKPSPVAFVPVPQLVPPHQRMQLEVSLTLPESDYNRRLGVFQVRAELLSADGKVVSASSQPCMLKFKSVHMHFIETFLQSVSLLSGYSSESQMINLKMTGIKKAFEPITGVRIVLEQRAEFSRGAGIPEIYDASLKLEAELPLLKRLLWHWRWTLFVWSSMAFFVFEMFLAVFCCRPCIFPRTG